VSLELALVVSAFACGAAGAIGALRARASARADRLALRLARAREAELIETARRLGDAARDGIETVREEIARAARTLAPALDAILVYEAHEGALTCIYAAGERVAYFAGSHLALDDGAALPVRALAVRHRVTLDDEGTERLHPADVAAVALPLAVDAGRLAVLVVSARVALPAEQVERLVQLAEQAAPAYRIALDRETDRHRAEYDGLTGLLSPRAFRARLGSLVERVRLRPGGSLALLFVDTDRFKDWNDSYGHACGDALLRELARLLREVVRLDDDLVARNGGDEFCLVLTETEKADAIERAELLRRRIVTTDFAALHPAGATAVRISASIGVAAYPADAASAHELLERADAAMYHSKRSGRDGVSFVDVDGALMRLDAAAV
jgi:diguanylate cyclase (GGDEF)-like protein